MANDYVLTTNDGGNLAVRTVPATENSSVADTTYVITRTDNDDLAVRTVIATEASDITDTKSVITRTTDGKLAVRTTGGGGSVPTIEALNVTPTTSAQTINAPAGTDGYDPVNVAAVTATIDSNIVAGNIKSGVSILGVSGTLADEYANVIDIENTVRGTDETVAESVAAACDNISQFLYGTDNQ